MKYHAMQALNLIHELRGKVLANGGNYNGLNLSHLQSLESQVLKDLPLVRDMEIGEAFFAYLAEVANKSLDQNANDALSRVLGDKAQGQTKVETIQPSPPAKSRSEIRARIFEKVNAEGDAIQPIRVARSSEEPSWEDKTPEVPPAPGLIDRVWEHFREELSINWFLFAGAFMVFASGLFYTLASWNELNPLGQYAFSVMALGLPAGLEALLRSRGLKKSPPVFGALYAILLPMVILVHLRLAPISLLLTAVLTYYTNRVLCRTYLGIDSPWIGSLQFLLVPLTAAGHPAISMGAGVLWLVMARFYLEPHPNAAGILFYAVLIASLGHLQAIPILWLFYLLGSYIVLRFPKAKGGESFFYFSALTVITASLVEQQWLVAFVSLLILSMRLHQMETVSPNPKRMEAAAVVSTLAIMISTRAMQIPDPVFASVIMASAYLTWYRLTYHPKWPSLHLLFAAILALQYYGVEAIHIPLLILSTPALVVSIYKQREQDDAIDLFLTGLMFTFGLWTEWPQQAGGLLLNAFIWAVLRHIDRREYQPIHPFTALCLLSVWGDAGFSIDRGLTSHALPGLLTGLFVVFKDGTKGAFPAFITIQLSGWLLCQNLPHAYVLKGYMALQILASLYLLKVHKEGLLGVFSYWLLADAVLGTRDLTFAALGAVLALVHKSPWWFWLFPWIAALGPVQADGTMPSPWVQLGRLAGLATAMYFISHWTAVRVYSFLVLASAMAVFALFIPINSPQFFMVYGAIFFAVVSFAAGKNEREKLVLLLALKSILVSNEQLIALQGSNSVLLLLLLLLPKAVRQDFRNTLALGNFLLIGSCFYYDLGQYLWMSLVIPAVLYVWRPTASHMELVQISISALLLNWPQHVLAPLVLFQIGLARYLRLRSYRTVLIFACLQLVGLATWCFSHGQAWPSIVALGCLSVYFFGLAIRNQAESLVVCGYVSLGAMFGTLKLFGIIGDLGISEFVLLVVSVLLERLCTRLKGDARIFLRPTQWVYEALPLILLVMQFVERDSPLLVLCSALVLEYFNQSEEMSHHRLAALVAINYALFLYAAPSGYVLELVSMSSGFSVLWYAHSMRQHLGIKSRQNLNIVGCGLFYMGSLYHFVIAATVESLVILWGLCFLSGLVALWFRSRLQLFSAMIIFCLSLVFFVVRQVLSQMSTGIPLVAGLGALLILCGVLLEQNRERLSSLFQSIEDYFQLKD